MPANSSVTQFRLAVDPGRFPSSRRLAPDYATAFDRLAPFFSGNPAEAPAWTSAVSAAREIERPRAAIADVVAEQMRQRGAPGKALDSARLLADRSTVAVVTGQQAGLFGGPLYTLLKALTTIKLAADVSARHNVPAVPVFWAESEDHDWNEVASCTVLDRDFEPHPVGLPPLPGAGRLPVSSIKIGTAAATAIDSLGELLPATEFTGPLLERLSDAYGPDRTLSEAFARWMLHLLGERGMVVFDASDPAAKPFVREVFKREIENPGRTAQLAKEAGEALAALGYHAQVVPAEDSVALFHLGDGRTPVRRSPDGFVVGTTTRTAPDMLKEVDERPSAFSPNVLLRPVVQDTLFPTVAYVSGPNELAYLAQLRGVYRHFNVPMPLMYQRASATLLDSSAVKFLTRTGLPFEALARDDEAELNRVLEEQLPEAVEGSWTRAREAITASMQALADAVPQVDPTLEGAAKSALGRMVHDIDALHAKIIQAAKRRDETLRRQFSRTRSLAFPGGEMQERAVGFIYFLNRYGPWLIDRLLSELPLEQGVHWVLAP